MFDRRHARPIRGGLRFAILSSLREHPMNGAELMDRVDKMTLGWWRPSPGSIYPLLESLEKEGLTKREPDGRYQITDDGRAEIESIWPWGSSRQPKTVDEMVDLINMYSSYFEDLVSSGDDRIKVQKERIKSLAERLNSIADNIK